MRNYKELFICICLLGLLSGLGATVINRTTKNWQQTQCKENLKAIHKMAFAYQAENNGKMVPLVDKRVTPWKFWYMFLLKHTNNPHQFYCPSNPKAKNFFTKTTDPLEPKSFSSASESYGMNYIFKMDNPKAFYSNIATPDYTIYFGDSQTPYLRPTKWCWQDDYAPRHNLRSNFVFIDGHVEAMNQENLGLMHKWNGWQKDVKRWKNWVKK